MGLKERKKIHLHFRIMQFG